MNPDEVVHEYGADALRLYEMFMGPLEASKPWSMKGVNGVYGFLDRVWRLIIDDRAEPIELNAAIVDRPPTVEENRMLHQTIGAVTEDIAKLSFNTAISRMMEFTNYFTAASDAPAKRWKSSSSCCRPSHRTWRKNCGKRWGTRNSRLRALATVDAALAKEDSIEVPVQVNGKVRAKINVPADADAAQTRSRRRRRRVAEHLAGKQIVKIVVVPGRLVNIVVKG